MRCDRRSRRVPSPRVSQACLDGGRRFCFLYTDLANPTSNKIYVDLGYERIGESREYAFARATQSV